MSSTTAGAGVSRSWITYALLLVLSWGVWGAFSGLPTATYGYPDEMVYVIWAFTMLIPAFFALRGSTWDKRGSRPATAWRSASPAPAASCCCSRR